MNIKKLNSDLREEAIRLGLCDEWQNMWRTDWGVAKMIAQFKSGIDFCMENHYPDKSFIKENFDRTTLRENFILVDDTYSLLNPKCAVIIGNSKSNIRFNTWSSGEVCVGGTSSVAVTARNSSFVMVHLYDNSTMTAAAMDKARIIVIKHSENVDIKSSTGDVRVKVRKEEDK